VDCILTARFALVDIIIDVGVAHGDRSPAIRATAAIAGWFALTVGVVMLGMMIARQDPAAYRPAIQAPLASAPDSGTMPRLWPKTALSTN